MMFKKAAPYTSAYAVYFQTQAELNKKNDDSL